MPKTYDVMTELRKRVSGRRQREFALEAGCSQSFLSEVVAGKNPPSDKMIDALGLVRVVTYQRKAKTK